MNIHKQIRNTGHRLTQQRKMVLKFINEQPLTVSEIFEKMKKAKIKIDLASVYRTLELLVEMGIVQEIELGDSKKRFELVNKVNHHHHIVCNGCGNLEDIANTEIENLFEKVKKQIEFKIDKHSLEFFGLCKQCQY